MSVVICFSIRDCEAASTSAEELDNALWLNRSKIETNGEIEATFDLDEHEYSHDLNKLHHVGDLPSSNKFTTTGEGVPSASIRPHNVSTHTIDENKIDDDLTSSAPWEESPQPSIGGVDHSSASESSSSGEDCQAVDHTVESSKVPRSDPSGTGDQVVILSEKVENVNESGRSSCAGVPTIDIPDHVKLVPNDESELSKDDGEASPTGRLTDEGEISTSERVSGHEPAALHAAGLESEDTSIEVQYSRSLDTATMSFSHEPIERGTQSSTSFESPHLTESCNDQNVYVTDQSETVMPTTGESCDASDATSLGGPGDASAAVVEGYSKASTQKSHKLSMVDATLHPPSPGTPNSMHAESQLGDASVRAEEEVNGDLNYGYTTIWGRKKGVTLDQKQLRNLFQTTEESVDQDQRNVSAVNQESVEGTPLEMDSSNEELVYDQFSDNMKAPKSVNTEFVEGLDDIDKFLEEVEPPDELDVGAAGSSIQEVLVGQGAQILTKHATIFLTRIQQSLQASRFKKFLASRRTETGKFRLVTMDELDRALAVFRSRCSDIFRIIQSLWDDMFDEDDESVQFEVEETTKIDSIRQVLLNQRVGSQPSTHDDTTGHRQEQLDQRP
ncbi:hypothetical protein MHU86_496 [Fragilaria crotonensis]|nr:hypothetical protein MHU86_496 [Fragilaria crotonensis]